MWVIVGCIVLGVVVCWVVLRIIVWCRSGCVVESCMWIKWVLLLISISCCVGWVG